MNHKLEFRFPGEILITSDTQIGHLMQTADSFEKTLMLRKIEGRRRRGRQRVRWLDGVTSSWKWSDYSIRFCFLSVFWQRAGGSCQQECCFTPVFIAALHNSQDMEIT